jgi:hypothetical protein
LALKTALTGSDGALNQGSEIGSVTGKLGVFWKNFWHFGRKANKIAGHFRPNFLDFFGVWHYNGSIYGVF